MDRFDLDRHTIDYLYRLFKDGRLDLRPAYQRGRVWNDGQRYALIESVKEQFPIGLIMLNVVPYADEDGTTVDNFDVVDGQQRMRTIIEYVDAAQWAKAEHRSDFRPYAKLTNAQQKRYMDYRVPIASMKEYEPEEITECYERLQRGKTLKMGEKLKAMLTYNAHTYVQGISKHRIFDLANGAHKVRDGHWTLATAFLKSLYGSDLFARQEFKHLSSFMRGPN